MYVKSVNTYACVYNILMIKLQSVNGKRVDKVACCVVCHEDCIGRHYKRREERV